MGKVPDTAVIENEPIAEANPFANNDEPTSEPVAKTVTAPADNPFTSNEKVKTPIVEKEVLPAVETNPFATDNTAPVTDASEVIKTETLDTEVNPFASTETQAPMADTVAESIEDESQTASNIFGDDGVTTDDVANPFSDDTNFAHDDDDVIDEDFTDNDFVDTNEVIDEDPLASLGNIKAEIKSFVDRHNQAVSDYENQIKVLKGKIKEEKKLLQEKKTEFRSMLQEIENLTDNFTVKFTIKSKTNKTHSKGQNKNSHNKNRNPKHTKKQS